MGKNDRKAREREALDRKRVSRRLQKTEVDAKIRKNLRKGLKGYIVQLGCGCCDAEVFFASDADIETAITAMGLTSSGVLVDQTGVEVHGVDTFYGFRRSDEPRRGLDFLLSRVLKP